MRGFADTDNRLGAETPHIRGPLALFRLVSDHREPGNGRCVWHGLGLDDEDVWVRVARFAGRSLRLYFFSLSTLSGFVFLMIESRLFFLALVSWPLHRSLH